MSSSPYPTDRQHPRASSPRDIAAVPPTNPTLTTRQLAVFGLFNEPFDPQDQFVFLDQKREHLVHLLQHLTVDTDLWLVLESPSGCGKTTLLELVRAEYERQQARVLYLSIGLARAEESISVLLDNGLDELADGLASGADLFADQPRYLILDDAEALPAKVLERLRNLQRQDEPGLKIILAGQPGTQDRIDRALAAFPDPPETHRLLLEAFDRDAMEQYIQQAFVVAGLEDELPFSEEQLEDIYFRSTGVPALVNREVLTELSGIAGTEQRRNRMKVASGGIFIALALAAVFYFFLQQGKEISEQNTVLLSLPAATPPAQGETGDQPTYESPQESPRELPQGTQPATEADQETTSEADALIMEALGPNHRPPLDGRSGARISWEPPAFAESVATQSSLQEQPAPDKPMQKPPEATAPQASPPMEKSVTQPDQLRREDWLLQQKDELFTLQVLLHSEESVVRRFIVDNRIAAQSAYYAKLVGGKRLYCLLYGLFPSPEESARALKQLPETLRRHGPWRRDLGAVKKEIRELGLYRKPPPA